MGEDDYSPQLMEVLHHRVQDLNTTKTVKDEISRMVDLAYTLGRSEGYVDGWLDRMEGDGPDATGDRTGTDSGGDNPNPPPVEATADEPGTPVPITFPARSNTPTILGIPVTT